MQSGSSMPRPLRRWRYNAWSVAALHGCEWRQSELDAWPKLLQQQRLPQAADAVAVVCAAKAVAGMLVKSRASKVVPETPLQRRQEVAVGAAMQQLRLQLQGKVTAQGRPNGQCCRRYLGPSSVSRARSKEG